VVAPNLAGTEDALDTIKTAVENAGYDSDEIMIALDYAASEFYVDLGKYDYTKFEGATGKNKNFKEQAEW
jgi:enolase